MINPIPDRIEIPEFIPTFKEVGGLNVSKDDYNLLKNTPDKQSLGLGNVDNTSDINKPISTATQTALNGKANINSQVFTGTPSLPHGTTSSTQSFGDSTTKLATTEFVTILGNTKSNLSSPNFSGTPQVGGSNILHTGNISSILTPYLYFIADLGGSIQVSANGSIYILKKGP